MGPPLGERLAKFGLKLNLSKTRLLRFEKPPETNGGDRLERDVFDFLGFTHYWAKSRRGTWGMTWNCSRAGDCPPYPIV